MGVKLLDRVRDAIRMRHDSRRTEDAYVYWIRRYIIFHKKVHPLTMGAPEISAFLTWLAVDQRLSASTQNQAFCAVLFLIVKFCKWTSARLCRCHAPACRLDYRSC